MLWLWMESQYLFEWLATSLNGMACAAIALCITTYQRHLSPRKGFCCAHRVLHRRHSCSEFVKRAIVRRGVLRAAPLVRRRFADCGQAALELRGEEKKRINHPHSSKAGNAGNSTNVIDACNCVEPPLECAFWGTQLGPDIASACSHAGATACDLGAAEAACCCWPF